MFVNKLKMASAVVLALAFVVGGGGTLVLPMFAVGEASAGQKNKDFSDTAKPANPGPDRDNGKKTPATAFDDCVVKDVVITTAVEVPHFIRVTLRGTQVQVGLSVAKDASVVINGKNSLPLQLQEGMQASLKLGSDGRTVTAIVARSRDDKVNSDKEDAKVEKEYIRVEIKGILHYDPPPLGAGGIQPDWGIVVQQGVTIAAKGITWRVAIDMDRKDLDSLPWPGSLKGKTVVAIGTLHESFPNTEAGVEVVRPILVVKSLKAVDSK